jgi:hypothetical protein
MKRIFSHSTLFALALFSVLIQPKQANAQALTESYREGLETLWQSLWGQGGVPTPVLRWVGPVKFYLAANVNGVARAHIMQGLNQAAKLTGVVFEDATHLGKTSEELRLVIEVASAGLNIDSPCYVEHQQIMSFRLQRVLLRMGPRSVNQCALHEIMHVMGITGHPNGQTQLSYTPKQKHTYTELDQLMLRTWYSEQARPGMNPFEMISLLSEQWMLLHMSADNQAEKIRNDFLLKIFDETLRYAEQSRAGNGRGLVIQYVAYAYDHGIITNKDTFKAERWRALGKQEN